VELKIKRITIIISMFIFCLLYLLYIVLVRESIAEVLALSNEINNTTLIYEAKLENYTNIESNRQLLLSLLEETSREIVSAENLPRAIISVSNIMMQNNIIENRFSLGNITRIYNDIFIQPINITGFGSYENIMNYLISLNNSNEFFLIDRIRLTKEDEDNFYLNLDMFIVTGDVNGW